MIELRPDWRGASSRALNALETSWRRGSEQR